MATATVTVGTKTTDAGTDLVYVNGIDFDTGTYAIPPAPIADWVSNARLNVGVDHVRALRPEMPREFAPPEVDIRDLESAGWGIVFHEETPQDIRAALTPLIDARRGQAKTRVKELDYRKGEQTKDWYERNGIAPGDLNPDAVPYYLLLAGPPTLIPFEFQYLLGIEYAVGRLAFDTPSGYEHYTRSILAYENGKSLPNAKEIVYWGTRHPDDPATELSASLLVDPLAHGYIGSDSALKPPVSAAIKTPYDQKEFRGDDATKASLLSVLHAGQPPALLFTASHGMSVRSGQSNQMTDQGALVCQDWPGPGYGGVRPEHFLAAADIADDANVSGLVAMLFACYGAGTPDNDQFLWNSSQAGKALPMAPQPFIAALPRRLLTHPNGAALAVIGHIDRAWSFSIKTPGRQQHIEPFYKSLKDILKGDPVGSGVSRRFGSHYAVLAALLLAALAPNAKPEDRLNDRELVSHWLERNDAQNYVLLGDPAARIRTDVLA